MSREAETLWSRYAADRSIENRNALVELYLPYLTSTAVAMRRKIPSFAAIESGDLVGYGLPGLIHSIERFDPSRGNKFETFAGLRVAGAMRDGIRSEDWVPRLERALEKQGKAKVVNVSSISAPKFTDDQGSRREFVDHPDTRAITAVERNDLRDTIRTLTRGLNKQERIVVLLYHVEGMTMKAVGESLGMSESRVSQIHTRVIKHIRARFDGKIADFLDHTDAQHHSRAQTNGRATSGKKGLRRVWNKPPPPPCHGAPSEPIDTKGNRMTDLIELLGSTKPEEVRREIDKRSREIVALKVILDALEARDGDAEAPDRPAPAGRCTQEEKQRRVQAIAELLRTNGAKRIPEIAEALNLTRGMVMACLDGERFEKVERGLWNVRA